MKKKIDKVFWCENCLNMSTRPRITFDSSQVCNACNWSNEKKKINWTKRMLQFDNLKKDIKSKKSDFDVIVPVSGGKDGSYVTEQMIQNGLKPLCITVNPPLRTELGFKNIENFKKNNLSLYEINLPYESHRSLNKFGFLNHGRPLYGWVIGIFTAVIKTAQEKNIKLIMYGEDGEAEYGGSTYLKEKSFFTPNFIKNIYFEKKYEDTIKHAKKFDMHWWLFNNSKIKLSHWSYYENWDSYRNYLVAKNKYGLEEKKDKNTATYTNFGQNDTHLYDLHCYLMYLKFGFGRCTQDIGIDIRRGAMSRDQGIQLAKIYDNEFPEEKIPLYLDYFQISQRQFDKTIEKFVNKSLFKKVGKKWKTKYKII